MIAAKFSFLMLEQMLERDGRTGGKETRLKRSTVMNVQEMKSCRLMMSMGYGAEKSEIGRGQLVVDFFLARDRQEPWKGRVSDLKRNMDGTVGQGTGRICNRILM